MTSKGDFITLKLPRKGLLTGTAELATRCKVSTRTATAMVANLVKMGGGDLMDCTLSQSSSLRHRQTSIKKSAEKIKKDFQENMPNFLILHWDSKIIKYQQSGISNDDRLAVVATIPCDTPRSQFLASPSIPDATGETMKDALINVLQEWAIPKERIIGMSWDTTSSNTGVRGGSATLFEEELGQGILWLACRHHIGELHVKHADQEVRGKWKSE